MVEFSIAQCTRTALQTAIIELKGAQLQENEP